MTNRRIINTALLAVSITISILLSEAVFRSVLNTVDFLQPTIVEDDLLGHRVSAGTGGHDALGFRNLRVPEVVDLVAVGDSMTYGVAATQSMSWPSQLAKNTGLSVYNLGLGGYGPLHYLELVKTYAFEFSPQQIVIGIYLGNDLMDAYNLAYGNSRWESYRILEHNTSVQPTNSVTVNAPPRNNGRFLGGLRQWLSQRSVLYAAITRSPIGDLVRESEANKSGRLSLEHVGAPTYFDLDGMSVALDLTDTKISEGMRLTRVAISEIVLLCRQRGVRPIVLFVPSKELVYAELLAQLRIDESSRDRLNDILQAEIEAREELMTFLVDQNVDIVDPASALRDAVNHGLVIYPGNDSHPNAKGYSIIASAVESRLAF